MRYTRQERYAQRCAENGFVKVCVTVPLESVGEIKAAAQSARDCKKGLSGENREPIQWVDGEIS